MSNILLALICLVLGKILGNAKTFPESSAQVLNAYVIYVALPALILVQVPKLALSSDIFAPVAIAWLLMGLSAGVVWLMSRYSGWSASTTGALMLAVTLGNTSFIGIPFVAAYLGEGAIPYAIIYDQLGTFLALNTLGIAIATRYSGKPHSHTSPLWSKIVMFPPFGALLCGFGLMYVSLPTELLEVLHRLADTLVPVVMVAVGLQWQLRSGRAEVRLIAFALGFMLVLKPLLAWVLVGTMTLAPLVAKTIVLEAAMPAMISASALAVTYGLAARLLSAIIGYSLMFSFFTVWVWSLIV